MNESNRYQLVFVYGAGYHPQTNPDCGLIARIMKEDHSKPHPYAILYEGHVDNGYYLWIKREDFRYIHGKLSSWQALDQIEAVVANNGSLNEIQTIINQYKQGKS